MSTLPENQVESLRAVTNWPREKASKAVRLAADHFRDMEIVIQLLAMGCTYRQALRCERRGMSPQVLDALTNSPAK